MDAGTIDTRPVQEIEVHLIQGAEREISLQVVIEPILSSSDAEPITIALSLRRSQSEHILDQLLEILRPGSQ